MPRAKSEKVETRMRLKVKSYDNRLIDNSVKQIVEAIKKQGGKIVGPIPLPTEFKKYTVNSSTFVHKKSREQFEIRIHKRIIDIINPDQKIIQSLTNLNLPSGIEIEIKTV